MPPGHTDPNQTPRIGNDCVGGWITHCTKRRGQEEREAKTENDTAQ